MSHSDEAIDSFSDDNNWAGETVDRMQISVAYGEVCRLETEIVGLIDRIKYYAETPTRETIEGILREIAQLKKVLE